MIIRKKRIPILPNLITTGNIFAGFYSIIHSIQGDYSKAAWAIVIGGIFDMLDGRIARLTNSQSEFGIQYDSLSDLSTFGFAPALLAYFWALHPWKVGWLGAFLFVVCAALRLARFNVQGSTKERDYFQGLPSPGAGGLVVCTVLFHQEFWAGQHLTFLPARIMFTVLVYALALLMVSGVRYRTFKSFSIKGMKPFRVLVLGALIIALIAYNPEMALLTIGYTYLASGLIETIFVLRKGVFADEEEESEGDDGQSNVTALPS